MADIYVTSAKYEDGNLVLKISQKQADRILESYKDGWYQLTQRKSLKSYEQIKLCWKLCELIAQKRSHIEKQMVSKMEIYKAAVSEVGRWAILTISNDAINDFAKEWGKNGLGWFVTFQEIGDEESVICAYYGCSVYNKKEMARLIDYLEQDAKTLNIDITTDSLQELMRCN